MQFLVEALGQRLAQQFGSQKALAAIGDLVFVVEWPRERQHGGHPGFQVGHTIALLRGNQQHLLKRLRIHRFGYEFQQFSARGQRVYFVDHQNNRLFHAAEHFCNPPVLLGPAPRLDQE